MAIVALVAGYLANGGRLRTVHSVPALPAALIAPATAAVPRLVLGAGPDYVRYDASGSSPVAHRADVRDVLVTPGVTVLMFARYAMVLDRRTAGTSLLGPADAVLPAGDHRAVLLVAGRGSSAGETVQRVGLDGEPVFPAIRIPPHWQVLGETGGRRLILAGPRGALDRWEPRTGVSARLADHVLLDSVIGPWLVTHRRCGGQPCEYVLRSLSGSYQIALRLPPSTTALGPPVVSADGVHFAVVVQVGAGDSAPKVALGVATVLAGGRDARFVVGVPYGRGHSPGDVQPAWSTDGGTVYVPRPVSGQVAFYRPGAGRAEVLAIHLADVTRVWAG